MTTSYSTNGPSSTNTSNIEILLEAEASKIFRTVLFSLSTLASLFGNTVMCKAACTFPSRKPLSYHLVTNLAVAELISTLCFPFPFVYAYVRYWPFGEFACKVAIPLQVLSMFVVTNTLAAIAVYRFLIVFQPSRRILTDYKIMILLLCLLWVYALVTIMPLFIFYKLLDSDKDEKIFCNAEFEGDDLRNKEATEMQKYDIVRFILNYGLPYVIMMASYGAVALKVKKHMSRSRTVESAEMSNFGKSTEQTHDEEGGREGEAIQPQDQQVTNKSENGTRPKRITEMETDLLKMIYVVILVYVVCYFPYQLHFLFTIFLGYNRYPNIGRYSKYIGAYSYLLLSFPSALHPLCYGTMSKFYARAFSKLVLCK